MTAVLTRSVSTPNGEGGSATCSFPIQPEGVSATNAYKAGVPLPSIQAITGHSSEAQLRRYLKLDAEEKAVIALKDFKGIIKI